MKISDALGQQIADTACKLIGTSYKEYDCVMFVRLVLSKHGIVLPKIARHLPPPAEFNLTRSVLLTQPPVGHPVFFKDNERLHRPWTHAGLVFSVWVPVIVHSSYDKGRVTITPLEDMLKKYETTA